MAGDPGAAGGAQDALRQPEPIRVLIVDDHALFRRGLEMVLAEEADIEVVGEASDGAEAVEKAGQALPDVVLMDIRMPRSSGIEACRAMKELSPSAKIVMLTISDEEEDLFEAIRAGVARGMNNRDIAKELFISENTVKNHVRNILEKLQIHSRMEAVMIAVRENLIEFG